MASVGLRITHLTRSLHLVVATHRHEASGWSDEVRRRHLHAWAEGRLEARRPALSSLWPVVLADDMLGAIDTHLSAELPLPYHAVSIMLKELRIGSRRDAPFRAQLAENVLIAPKIVHIRQVEDEQRGLDDPHAA